MEISDEKIEQFLNDRRTEACDRAAQRFLDDNTDAVSDFQINSMEYAQELCNGDYALFLCYFGQDMIKAGYAMCLLQVMSGKLNIQEIRIEQE